MKLLFAIPHYFDRESADLRYGSSRSGRERRLRALTQCIASIHQHFGRPQCIVDHARKTTLPTNEATAESVSVVVCTTGDKHLLTQLSLDPDYFSHHDSAVDSRYLGFECHHILGNNAEQYDYCCYLEDDLVFHDSWFFQKLRWFASEFGNSALLMPHRYEVTTNSIVHKAYADGPLRPKVTAALQNISDEPLLRARYGDAELEFVRPTNPHSGAFFLNRKQALFWREQPGFGQARKDFIGPLESAATLSVMQAFRIYKPRLSMANFLEIEHADPAYINEISLPRD